jgi:DNA-binding transcriptional LysR family regulator
VHISQSGVSARIRQLEQELGAELFDRSARTVTLTVAGRAALEHARAALAAAGAVGQAADEVADLIRGRLTVGMVTGCTLTPLFDALAAFHRAHPGVEISLLEDSSDRLTEGVRTGAVDVALIGAATDAPDELEALTIISEPAQHYRDRLTARTIGDVDAPAPLAPVWKSMPSPGARELLVHSRQACTRPGTEHLDEAASALITA